MEKNVASFHSFSNAKKIRNENDIDHVFELIYSTNTLGLLIQLQITLSIFQSASPYVVEVTLHYKKDWTT